jgi:hypothetical protein
MTSQVVPGSDESMDVLADSLEYSFVDLPELLDEDGKIVEEEDRLAVSFNPYFQRRQQQQQQPPQPQQMPQPQQPQPPQQSQPQQQAWR